MIPRECKRLAEVDFPIAEVSKHAAREKSIRHGHPSTLHLWWARRPQGSSRAVLLALLLPDPCDPNCPEAFKGQAREILGDVRQPPKSDEELQRALLWFIGSFANWDLSSEPVYLRVARNLVKAANPEATPLVVDPFSGGGSIPLEALRLGCEAFATDLNPVALLILKVMLEDVPRHGPALADELRRVGGAIKRKAEEELSDLYPPDADGAKPIAYLWSRTVRCESPNCGAEIPLFRSLWLSKKASRRRALRTRITRPIGEVPQVEFEIFEPVREKEVAAGSVARAKASCLCCGTVLPPARVRAQLVTQNGGADVIFDDQGRRAGGARLTAVVTLKPGKRGRQYRLPTDADYAAVCRAQTRVSAVLAEWEGGGRQGPCPMPDEHVDEWHHDVNRLPMYGMRRWSDAFTARQKMALYALRHGVLDLPSTQARDVTALAVSRITDYGSALTTWVPSGEFIRGTFGRQALPMVWDFSEAVPWTESSGNFNGALDWVLRVIEAWPPSEVAGQVQSGDATAHPLPDQAADVWFTDPPYYDAIDYAHCSDFFFVWLKRTLPGHPLIRDPYDRGNPLTPKSREVVVDSTTTKGHGIRTPEFYERSMATAFAEARRILRDDGIGTVVFAHKTTEGWEALLSGMIRGGWTITGSWPIATERPGRLRSQNSAALETSVHLICRPRPESAPIGDWANVLRELPTRVGLWIERLQSEGIRGADLVFACIGPALEIFSRYRLVETAEGREVGLPEYLEKVWEVVGRAALQQVLGNGDSASGALEEDARMTALFLWTLQSTEAPDEKEQTADEEEIIMVAARGLSLPFDVVRRFAQPMGIDLDVWTDRIIAQEKGVVRLFPVAERAKALFGENGTRAAVDWIESDTGGDLQGMLFPDMDSTPKKKKHSSGKSPIIGGDTELQSPDATTLDRVHAAMLLQAGGQANALRKLLITEQDRGPDFLRLANALSALYPKGSEEKRLLDAMLLAVPR